MLSPALLAKTFFILGPTAVGKSAFAIEFALRAGAEIVGADAFQIYAGLDVLTAKPSPEERARVPHHLLGEVPPAESFDVGRYVALATARIAEIVVRGRRVVVAGGTGLYVRALTRGLAELPRADAGLRARLESQPLDALARQLVELDPVAARQIDLRNPRRVIRALEVCLLTGEPFSSLLGQWDATPPVRGIILTRERAALNARIDERTVAMFAAGVVEEVRTAGELGPTAAQVLGLRDIRALLAGEMTREACIAAIQQATRQYAKRQATWFRREPGFETLDLGIEPAPAALAGRLAAHFLAPEKTDRLGGDGR